MSEMIDGATQIARKEWANLRCSLEMCGDIGVFNPDELAISNLRVGQEYERLRLRSNIIDMDKKLLQYEYFTPEALYVLTTLASMAAEKLGLREELASAFGMGYGFVRTGLVAYHGLELRQILFHKMFFPFGGLTSHGDINCDLAPSLVKTKLKIVFERFRSWQNNPLLYTEDVERFQSIDETWKEWEEVNW
jgi:hypothetical protein